MPSAGDTRDALRTEPEAHAWKVPDMIERGVRWSAFAQRPRDKGSTKEDV